MLVLTILVNQSLTSTCSFWSGFGNCYTMQIHSEFIIPV